MPHTIKIKYDSIDVLKFILSFLIIQIHTEFYFIWMKPYVRLAVPIFFIISAFFFFRRNPGKEQLIGYIKRLSILYLFWFIVWGLYFVYANRAIVFSSQGFVFILRSLVFGSTFAASWYIAASIIGTISAPGISAPGASFFIFHPPIFRLQKQIKKFTRKVWIVHFITYFCSTVCKTGSNAEIQRGPFGNAKNSALNFIGR